MAHLTLSCGACGGDLLRAEAAESRELLVCARCGRARGPGAPVIGSGTEDLEELRLEVRRLREELTRLRQAVNFLNQRVR